jgi:hypothetical protein
MAAAKLRLVAQPDTRRMKRVQELQDEARAIAMAEVAEFEAGLIQLVAQARELVEAGESIPAGVRELCRSFAEDGDARAKTLSAITLRSRADLRERLPTPAGLSA